MEAPQALKTPDDKSTIEAENNMNKENRGAEMPASEVVDAIHDRALRFAGTFAFVNPQIVRSVTARDDFVIRYGAPGSTEYREIEIHMDYGPEQHELINSSDLNDKAAVEMFMKSGVELLVVCSSVDVIHHEFLRTDLD
jgi:hypothetical protein